uniref:Uncharacterized protein n=1 Tax=Oryza brachyantha TaxID=4533 RepID=J3M3M2_ORYBR
MSFSPSFLYVEMCTNDVLALFFLTVKFDVKATHPRDIFSGRIVFNSKLVDKSATFSTLVI